MFVLVFWTFCVNKKIFEEILQISGFPDTDQLGNFLEKLMQRIVLLKKERKD